MQLGTERAKACLERAQQRQKACADKGRRDVTYEVGDKLLLNTKNVRWKALVCLDSLVHIRC